MSRPPIPERCLGVVIPVYNEEQTLEVIVRKVLARPEVGELVMVDDRSQDDTWRVMEALARTDDRIRVFRHEVNQGKGAALRTGFAKVTAEIVIIQDADLEYDPHDYGALVRRLDDRSLGAVFGNRWAGAERRTGYRRMHELANGFLTALSNRATGLGVHDMECCYKLLRIPVLRAIRPSLTEERFGIEPQIAAALARNAVRVGEVPVAYAPRSFAEGKKIRWTDGVRTLWVIARERFRGAPAGGGAR